MERGQLELTPDAVTLLLEAVEDREQTPSLLQTKLTAAKQSLTTAEESVVAITVSEDDVSLLIDMLPAPSPDAHPAATDLRTHLTTFLRELRT